MQNSVIQIGNYSYYPNKALGQGTHSTVYLGNFEFINRFSKQR